MNPFKNYTVFDVQRHNLRVSGQLGRDHARADFVADCAGEKVERPLSGRAFVPHNPNPTVLKIVMTGQIRGGKNNMIVTRSGHRFPKKEWAKWRDAKVAEIRKQLPYGFAPIHKPVEAVLCYVAGDKKRRDMPAIIDSIFHCLERANVVTDDTLLWVTTSSRCYDKQNPRVEIEIIL